MGDSEKLHSYRSHDCGALRGEHVGEQVRLSGWIHRKRDHGGLLFIDLRDHYGLTQIVVDSSDNIRFDDRDTVFSKLDRLRVESVICVTGRVVARSDETINPRLPTGAVEIQVTDLAVLSEAAEMPLPVAGEADYPEDIRLKYRFIDLRRERLHRNITLRSRVIASLRRRMIEQGFTEYQTPILTASSPEGARDYLVPSRTHPGKFYALPQAPQMFKQLIMAAGFDRYFQIAPCFRDEDARADRSPGEFYQLDFEMSFVTQEDVFAAIEPVLAGVFEEFADYQQQLHTEDSETSESSQSSQSSATSAWAVTEPPFPRLSYALSMRHFGTDKPDLRNPLHIQEVTDIFRGSGFSIFANMIEKGAQVHAIRAPDAGLNSRKFFDDMNLWAQAQGFAGLGYINFKNGEAGGPIAKNLGAERVAQLREAMQRFADHSKDWSAHYRGIPECADLCFSADMPEAEVGDNDGVFLACGESKEALRQLGLARTEIANRLGLIDSNRFAFCWIVDFPMFERDEATDKIIFSHNPFSMPQGEMEVLQSLDPLEILAQQYDIVCNGVELSSGAIRNHRPDIMYKAFAIAGYSKEEVDRAFPAMLNAFRYGVPPHGGSAPGVDRIVMLLAGEENIREVVAFPMNQKAEDLMMNAPAEVDEAHLRLLGLKAS